MAAFLNSLSEWLSSLFQLSHLQVNLPREFDILLPQGYHRGTFGQLQAMVKAWGVFPVWASQETSEEATTK